MTWFDHAEKGTFPLEQRDAWRYESMTADTCAILHAFIIRNCAELDIVTVGDREKEEQLGGILVSLANQSANGRQRTLEGLPLNT